MISKMDKIRKFVLVSLGINIFIILVFVAIFWLYMDPFILMLFVLANSIVGMLMLIQNTKLRDDKVMAIYIVSGLSILTFISYLVPFVFGGVVEYVVLWQMIAIFWLIVPAFLTIINLMAHLLALYRIKQELMIVEE